jgi:hypothetical protein
MYCYAEAAIQYADPQYAGPLFDRLAPWAGQSVASGSVAAAGLVSYSLGGLATVLRRYEEAEAYFDRAAAMSTQMNAQFFAAMTDLRWGSMLAQRQAEDDTKKARVLLIKARTAAVAHGYGNVERRASATLTLLDT